jgi:hypothetical protein
MSITIQKIINLNVFDKHFTFNTVFPENIQLWDETGCNFIKLYDKLEESQKQNILNYLEIVDINEMKYFYAVLRLVEKNFTNNLEIKYKKGDNLIKFFGNYPRDKLFNFLMYIYGNLPLDKINKELENDTETIAVLNREDDRNLLMRQLEIRLGNTSLTQKSGGMGIKKNIDETKNTETQKGRVRSLAELEKILGK